MNPDVDEVPPRRLFLGAAVAVIIVGALTVNLWWFTNVGLLLASVAGVVAIALVAQRLIQTQRPIVWETQPQAPEERRGADARVSTLRHQIEQASRGERSATQAVHALVTDLAHERLHDRRALTRTDPEADALLGPDLAAYLDHPPAGAVSADRLRNHVQKLEELS